MIHHLPKGFKFSGIHAGLKDSDDELDLALFFSEQPAESAGVFTKNRFPGEPVKLAKSTLKKGRLQAIVVNSKISNVATGEQGRKMAVEICDLLGKNLKISSDYVTINSTGIIGRLYPEGKIQKHLPVSIQELGATEQHLYNAAKAIMTTDTKPKVLSKKIQNCSICLVAKGAGMIAPNMATMLVYILTDAKLSHQQLQPILKRVTDKTFNCLSIDFDTSTSDSCIVMANGYAGEIKEDEFEDALLQICSEASMEIVKDGEGVDKVIDCRVEKAANESLAKNVARSVINSPLVKTMITGADPNWGRLIMAIGKVDDELLDHCEPTIFISGECVLKQGKPTKHDLNKISDQMKRDEIIPITIQLNSGSSECRYLGANLTKDYVSINADYTT